MIAVGPDGQNIGVLPYVGAIHAANSGGPSVTGPTALSALDETLRYVTNDDYTTVAQAISEEDAAWLNKQLGRDDIPAGLIVAAPFDPQGNINREVMIEFLNGEKTGQPDLAGNFPEGSRQATIYSPAQNRDLFNTAIDELLAERDQALGENCRIAKPKTSRKCNS